MNAAEPGPGGGHAVSDASAGTAAAADAVPGTNLSGHPGAVTGPGAGPGLTAAPVVAALAAQVGAQLREHGLLLATAESCTGGLIAGAVTDVAGSSAWFDRGFVTYSNAAKTQMLGVPAALIERFGAVSEPVAAAMAEGALAHSDAGIAVSVTGVAGPGGGTPDKPVGMVCFGWARRSGLTVTATVRFPGVRAAVRAQTVRHALDGLLIWLDEPRPGR